MSQCASDVFWGGGRESPDVHCLPKFYSVNCLIYLSVRVLETTSMPLMRCTCTIFRMEKLNQRLIFSDGKQSCKNVRCSCKSFHCSLPRWLGTQHLLWQLQNSSTTGALFNLTEPKAVHVKHKEIVLSQFCKAPRDFPGRLA